MSIENSGAVATGALPRIASAMTSIRPDLEAGLCYFCYFLTERGRAGLTANRRDSSPTPTYVATAAHLSRRGRQTSRRAELPPSHG